MHVLHCVIGTLDVVGYLCAKEVEAGRCGSMGTLPQEKTLEGSTLPPPLMSLLLSNCNMVLHGLFQFQVSKQRASIEVYLVPRSLTVAGQR